MRSLFIVLQKLLKSLCTIVFLYAEMYNCIETNATCYSHIDIHCYFFIYVAIHRFVYSVVYYILFFFYNTILSFLFPHIDNAYPKLLSIRYELQSEFFVIVFRSYVSVHPDITMIVLCILFGFLVFLNLQIKLIHIYKYNKFSMNINNE